MNINRVSNINQYATMLTKQTQVQNKAHKTTELTASSAKNNNVDTVEITVISDLEKAELERRAALDKVSPQEALMAALATAPNNEDVERSKELAAKFGPIQAKMLAGKPLTTEEKSFIQKHYPELAAIGQRVEREVQELRNQVKNSNSKEESSRLIMEKKMQFMNAGKNDSFILFMMPAFDEAFR